MNEMREGIRTNLLRQVADRIEGLPVHRASQLLKERAAAMFSMSVLVTDVTVSEEVGCGTAACIAGWLALILGETRDDGRWVSEAIKRTGLGRWSIVALCAPFAFWRGGAENLELHTEFHSLWEGRKGDEEATAAAIVCRAVADMAEVAPESIDGPWIMTHWIHGPGAGAEREGGMSSGLRGLAPLLGLAAMFGEPAIGFSRPIPSDGPKVRYNRRNVDSDALMETLKLPDRPPETVQEVFLKTADRIDRYGLLHGRLGRREA